MKWKKNISILMALIISVMALGLVTAYDFDPGRDINLREIYSIKYGVNADFVCLNLSGDYRCEWPTEPGGLILHSSLAGLQGGTTDQYYHLNESIYNRIISFIFSWITGDYFDQDLNTTDDVKFRNITASNITAEYYFGNGSQLTGISTSYTETDPIWSANYSAYNSSWTTTNAEIWNVVANNTYIPYTGANQNVDLGSYNITTSWFKGIFNWIIGSTSTNYLSFNGTQLEFNETYLNETISGIEGDNYYPSNVNLTSGTYTGSLVNGSNTGYDAGNSICNTEFSGSHMCNEFEILQWFAKEDSPTVTGDAWCSTGAPKYIPADIPVNDCHGWTHGSAGTYLGNYWHFNSTTGGVGRAINCGTNLKLACCNY